MSSTLFVARAGTPVAAIMDLSATECLMTVVEYAKAHHCRHCENRVSQLDETGLCVDFCSGVVEVSP